MTDMDLLKASRPIVVAIALLAAVPARGARSLVTDIAVKDRSSSYASLAATGRFVAIAWAGRTADGVTDIYSATSRDGGGTFGAPARVNQVAGDARVSGEQPPRIALVPRSGIDPAIVVVWTAKAATGTRLLSARSDNGGRSFAAPLPVPGSDASGNRGWESIATNREGRVVALWLDHREVPAARPGGSVRHAEHQHGPPDGPRQTDGVARAQLSKLFFARLDDPDTVHALAGGVCYCCKTALATSGDGSVYAAWRHVYAGNIRDIAFALSRDGGRTFAAPVRVSDDGWVLNGCPENGPALAVDARHGVHVVWPTVVNGSASSSEPTLALFYASSQDGRRFSARQLIPTDGTPRHPQVAITSRGSLVVAWDEQRDGTRRVVVSDGAAGAGGPVRFARVPMGIGERGEYPAVAAVENGYVIAWTSGPPAQSVIRVARITPRE
jgi:hypothetical protein